MSDMKDEFLEFAVSGWIDQIQINYSAADGSLDDHQDRPGFKLFGYTYDGVLVECVCVVYQDDDSNRSVGSIYPNAKGNAELFGLFLVLPPAQFEWLWKTLTRCQDCLSNIEVSLRYEHGGLPKPAGSQKITISIAAFTLRVGEYFSDKKPRPGTGEVKSESRIHSAYRRLFSDK